MKAIVAVDNSWGIGYQGNLLAMIPEDLKYFKEKTLGQTVVMGRTTLESLPMGKPLKDRVNIVLSRDVSYENDQVVLMRTIDELFDKLPLYQNEIFVIGGESVYRQLLPHCEEAYVTKIDQTYSADKHFVNLDQHPDWELVSTSEVQYFNEIPFTFNKYRNRNLKKSI